jgi:hypothetical protein
MPSVNDDTLDPEVVSTVGAVVVTILLVWMFSVVFRVYELMTCLRPVLAYRGNQKKDIEERLYFADYAAAIKTTVRALTVPSLPREDVPVVRCPITLHSTSSVSFANASENMRHGRCDPVIRVSCMGTARIVAQTQKSRGAMCVLSGRALLFASYSDVDEFISINLTFSPRAPDRRRASLFESHRSVTDERDDTADLGYFTTQAALQLTGSGFFPPQSSSFGGQECLGSGQFEPDGQAAGDDFVGGIVMRIEPLSEESQCQILSFDLSQDQAEQIVLMKDAQSTSPREASAADGDSVVPMVWLLKCLASATINATSSSEAEVITLVYTCECAAAQVELVRQSSMMPGPLARESSRDDGEDGAAVAYPVSTPPWRSPGETALRRTPELSSTPAFSARNVPHPSPRIGEVGNFDGEGAATEHAHTEHAATERDQDSTMDDGPDVFSAISASIDHEQEGFGLSGRDATETYTSTVASPKNRAGRVRHSRVSSYNTASYENSINQPPPRVMQTEPDASLDNKDFSMLVNSVISPPALTAANAERVINPVEKLAAKPDAGLATAAQPAGLQRESQPVKLDEEEVHSYVPPFVLQSPGPLGAYIDLVPKLYGVIFRDHMFKTHPIYHSDTGDVLTPQMTLTESSPTSPGAGIFNGCTASRTIVISDTESERSLGSIPDADKCIICFHQRASAVLLPCAHFSICCECVLKVTRCPECRSDIRASIVTGPEV